MLGSNFVFLNDFQGNVYLNIVKSETYTTIDKDIFFHWQNNLACNIHTVYLITLFVVIHFQVYVSG